MWCSKLDYLERYGNKPILMNSHWDEPMISENLEVTIVGQGERQRIMW